ncbi:hypothetical protein GWO13_01735, partial [Candidatus Bathyarchaeota archaeon]|nr:hypothetical protein [Candidatus Bathyarchaeota archaeon]
AHTNDLNQPATKGFVREEIQQAKQDLTHKMGETVKQVLDSKLTGFRDELTEWKSEILTSNDKISKKLDQVLTEQKAITVNYQRVDQRVDRLEEFARQAAPKLDLEFEKAS